MLLVIKKIIVINNTEYMVKITVVTFFSLLKIFSEHYDEEAVFRPLFPESTLWFCKMDKKNVQNRKIFFQFG
jgi:hypothetical protein